MFPHIGHMLHVIIHWNRKIKLADTVARNYFQHNPSFLCTMYILALLTSLIQDVFCLSLSCAPYVANFSGLSNFDCPFGILQRLFVDILEECNNEAIPMDDDM
jgi:hypothetical protein